VNSRKRIFIILVKALRRKSIAELAGRYFIA
jgi:hypothetical protein